MSDYKSDRVLRVDPLGGGRDEIFGAGLRTIRHPLAFLRQPIPHLFAGEYLIDILILAAYTDKVGSIFGDLPPNFVESYARDSSTLSTIIKTT